MYYGTGNSSAHILANGSYAYGSTLLLVYTSQMSVLLKCTLYYLISISRAWKIYKCIWVIPVSNVQPVRTPVIVLSESFSGQKEVDTSCSILVQPEKKKI